MPALLFLSLLALGLAGCQSHRLGPYGSPRVSGQVLAADTHQPLAGVKVLRGLRKGRDSNRIPPKGAELLMLKEPVLTQADGRFVMGNERVLSVFRGSQWNVLWLSFSRSGYQPFQTNYPTSLATPQANGQLLLDAGQILLQPAR